jgi:hypothetical protein
MSRVARALPAAVYWRRRIVVVVVIGSLLVGTAVGVGRLRAEPADEHPTESASEAVRSTGEFRPAAPAMTSTTSTTTPTGRFTVAGGGTGVVGVGALWRHRLPTGG